MMIEKEGKTVEAAIEAALSELNLPEEEVEVEILRREGLFKTACVRVTVKAGKEEKAAEFVNGLMEKMNLNIKAELGSNEEGAVINLVGEDNGIAIGYRGEVLDAIQYLALLAVNKNNDKYFKITVDAESYRDKRRATLEHLAMRLASKAIKSGRAIEVEPMNPYERKVFHTVLADNPGVRTESEGEEPNRYVVITPVEKESEYLSDFSKKGVGKVKTFGAKKKFF